MSNIEEFMLPCLNKKLFGLECMGCGMQRSLLLILKGDFIGALNMYPAIYTLIVLFGFIAINSFKKIRHSNIIITVLASINAIIIVSSYIIKTFFNH